MDIDDLEDMQVLASALQLLLNEERQYTAYLHRQLEMCRTENRQLRAEMEIIRQLNGLAELPAGNSLWGVN